MTAALPLPGMPEPVRVESPVKPEPLPRKVVTTSSTPEVVAALRARFSTLSPGNGPRYVIATEVRNRAGFAATRSCDAVVIDTWPSSGLAVHGFEVKVSRSDWLRELADPTKAEAFRPYCDFWWLVVGDPKIVRPGELPAGWGLMTYTVRAQAPRWDRSSGRMVEQPPAATLRTATAAPKLQSKPIPRTLLVPLLRSVANRPAGRP